MADTRVQELCIYDRKFLLVEGLMLFLLKLGSRRQVRFEMDSPQLRMCMCLDGLYANGTVLSICRENHWKYFITFKEGSMPAVWKEYQTLLELCPQNRRSHTTDAGVHQSFAWVENLQYVDDQNRRQRFGAMQCREQNGRDTKFFAWLTNFTMRPENVVALGNRGGRCRWKIENEGFNIQKNGGFNLEHAYGMGERQIKNYYVLLQIAHMILQLIECGNLLSADVKQLFGSLSNLARRLAESIRNRLIHPEAIDPAAAQCIQIRLDSS